MSERRFGVRSTQGEGHIAALQTKVHYGHTKGDAAIKFEALSSACQIVNERLMKCVQPEHKTNKAELMPFKRLFSKSSLE